jgi:hypothetical protein
MKDGKKRQAAEVDIATSAPGKKKSWREQYHEVRRSHARGNGILGVYLHNIKDFNQKTDTGGTNQFGEIGKDTNGNSVYFWSLYPTYDWVINDGYNNLGKWVEEAAKKVGR